MDKIDSNKDEDFSTEEEPLKNAAGILISKNWAT